MKKNKYILLTLLFIFTTLAITTNAHFGSKGPFGGSVSTMLTVDSTVYIGTFTGSVYQSSNSRLVTWTPRPVGIKSGSITALAHTGKYLFAATADSGIFYFNSIPKEKYWVKKNIGLGSLKVTSLIAIDSITLFAGTNGGGIFKTTNKGDNWTAVNNATLHHLNITALAKIGTRVIHTAEDGGIYASDDFGASWFDFNNINTNDISGTNILSVNAVLNEVLVLNKNGLFKGSLTTLPSVTPPDYNFADMGLPQGIKISSISNDGTNWYLSTNMGIFTSSTTAISWVNINMGLPTLDATFILPFQNKLVSSVRNEGIFTANKDFTIWTVSNAGFNNIVTYSLATSGELVVVAATEKGIFVSKDLAASYVSANKGLTDSLHVNDITFADFRLLAATKKAGIFISIDTGKTWSPMNDGIFGLDIKKIIYCYYL